MIALVGSALAILCSLIPHFGLPIAITASTIALWGVYLFNQRKDYTGARVIWFFSNALFVIYFLGRCAYLWDGPLGDYAMLVYFAVMFSSNLYGLMK